MTFEGTDRADTYLAMYDAMANGDAIPRHDILSVATKNSKSRKHQEVNKRWMHD